jgi:hypothetical protein
MNRLRSTSAAWLITGLLLALPASPLLADSGGKKPSRASKPHRHGHHGRSRIGLGGAYRGGYSRSPWSVGVGYGYGYGHYRHGDRVGSSRPPYYGADGLRRHGKKPSEIGGLDLDVRPKRTRVLINGRDVGKTGQFDGSPRFLYLEPGSHVVVLRPPEGPEVRRTFDIEAGVTVQFEQDLR